jgi:hypothetical protein
VLTIAGYAAGFGIAMRFYAAWRQRQSLREREAPDDDALDVPGSLP